MDVKKLMNVKENLVAAKNVYLFMLLWLVVIIAQLAHWGVIGYLGILLLAGLSLAGSGPNLRMPVLFNHEML